jgi:hypothetical protein
MLKLLGVISLLVIGMTVFVAIKDERATERHAKQTSNASKQPNESVVPKPNEKCPDEDVYNPERDSPRWYGVFRWPNGITTWALLLTLAALIEQTRHIAKGAEATLTQSEIANKTLIAQFRPKVIVRRIFLKRNDSEYEGDDGQKFFTVESWSFSFEFTNVGGTNAIVEDNYIEIRWDKLRRDGATELIKIESFKGFSLKSGEDRVVSIEVPERGSHIQNRMEIARARGRLHGTPPQENLLCCEGCIRYTDMAATQRKTGFLRQWDVIRERFIASTNPEDEYQD